MADRFGDDLQKRRQGMRAAGALLRRNIAAC
jgi:hypothetical protein